MLAKPRWLLHLEGVVIFAATIYLYSSHYFSWGLFALLFLAPDFFRLGYLINEKWGAAAYNLAHTYVGSVILLLATILPSPSLTQSA
jgi:hypothetical protein